MEALLKKYFWVLKSLGVTAVVALAASTVTTYVGSSFLYVEKDSAASATDSDSDSDSDGELDEDDKPTAATPSASARSRSSSRKARSESDKEKLLSGLLSQNLFCPSCAPPPPPPPLTTTDPAVIGQEPPPLDLSRGGGVQPGEVRTSLPLKLIVTMESSDPRYSQATLLNTETASVRPYWPGDTITRGAVLAAVERGLIHIRNNGQAEYLELGAEVPPPKPKKPKVEPVAEEPKPDDKLAGASDAIKCESENSCTVDRAFVESLFANPMALAKQARVVPSVVDGETRGFKFYGIRNDSLPKMLGLKNGDLLTSVNGNEVKTVDDAMSLVTKLRQASNLSIAIERKGKTINKEITIQ
ncbi:MAG: hypothetical protein IPK80_24450 [Nannocystis sp.]|nr:hypothetical protein [Nannocystis sp.]